MSYFSELSMDGATPNRDRALPGSDQPTNYRVAYRKRITDEAQYKYFETSGEAYREVKRLRQDLYLVSRQTWHARERRWIG